MTTLAIQSQPATRQDFGPRPEQVRETDHYRAEYVRSFVEKWDELIDWDQRALGEGDFFIRHLRERGARRVLDVATGTGFHSVRLLEAGFDVVSADGSPEMLSRAFDNARSRGHILRTVQADWRLLNRDIHETFDAVICLGNSFTHLFREADRRKALAEFYAVLDHDGFLVLDQRNYDSILEGGYSGSHAYYYCADHVRVEPEHVDEGLARFAYEFPDGSIYHLNMFPLRRAYTRRLMREVGFQRIDTYGDFREQLADTEPEFLVHVAHKSYQPEEGRIATTRRGAAAGGVEPEVVQRARDYYDSDDAEAFYAQVWGGEDIHIGLYASPGDSIRDASRRTVKRLAEHLEGIGTDSRILDLGSGYGGAARYLARTLGCRVVALNLSGVENERARRLNRDQGLDDRIEVVDGSFDSLPYGDASFDAMWSQDALLHSGNRAGVVAAAARVLRPGGALVFTDIMQADDCPPGVLQPILDRIHLDSLGSPAFYRTAAARAGLELVEFEELTESLTAHYGRVLAETLSLEPTLRQRISAAFLERMVQGLGRWIEGGEKGWLVWGIFHCRRVGSDR